MYETKLKGHVIVMQ